MDAPVDLTNLRGMTDGDKEMEKALFEEFYASFEKGMDTLQANTGSDAAETWRKEAHALKGMSLNLGANRLGEIGKKAQDGFQSDANAKLALLDGMRAEYAKVKQFLQTI